MRNKNLKIWIITIVFASMVLVNTTLAETQQYQKKRFEEIERYAVRRGATSLYCRMTYYRL